MLQQQKLYNNSLTMLTKNVGPKATHGTQTHYISYNRMSQEGGMTTSHPTLSSSAPKALYSLEGIVSGPAIVVTRQYHSQA